MFSIRYRIGDNMEACIELLTKDWTNDNVSAISLYTANNSLYFKTPIAIDLAINKCSDIISNLSSSDLASGYPSIYFFFGVDFSKTTWKDMSWQN